MNYTDFINILKQAGFKINQNQDNHKTLLDWKSFKNHYSLFYDYEGNEDEIREKLYNSNLNSFEGEVILEMGKNEPILKVDKNNFILNWYDYVAQNGFMGMSVITDDGKYIMEFTDDSEWNLYSNFKI